MDAEERALKREDKLARFDLIPPRVLWLLAEHYGRCVRKYPPNNWRKGRDWSSTYSALQRHLNAFWAGENYDKDEKLDSDPEAILHLVSALWNIVCLIDSFENHPELDDRYSNQQTPLIETVMRGASSFALSVVPDAGSTFVRGFGGGGDFRENPGITTGGTYLPPRENDPINNDDLSYNISHYPID